MPHIIVIKEAVELRGSGGAREGWEEGTWERLVGGRERGNDTITFSLNFSKKLKKTNQPHLVVLGPTSELALLPTRFSFLLFVFYPTLLQ